MHAFMKYFDQLEERPVSLIARHQSVSLYHHYMLSFHGIWAVACWVAISIQWLLPKRQQFFHQQLGRAVLFCFLLPLELTGLLLCPYLFMNVPRANILLTSGHLVVPSMGFLFMITTQRAFLPALFPQAFRYFNYFNIILQILGSAVLVSKIIHLTDTGLSHENNIELLFLTVPFTLLQIYLTFPQLSGGMRFGHSFYTRYLTLQLFPGSLIVVARDHYWLWASQKTLVFRLTLDAVVILPFYDSVLSFLYKARKNTQATRS